MDGTRTPGRPPSKKILASENFFIRFDPGQKNRVILNENSFSIVDAASDESIELMTDLKTSKNGSALKPEEKKIGGGRTLF